MISKNPTADELVQYATWLAEAEAALHRLLTGAQEVTVSHEGESVTFRQATEGKLRSYIAELRAALGKGETRNQGLTFKPVVFGRARGGAGGLF